MGADDDELRAPGPFQQQVHRSISGHHWRDVDLRVLLRPPGLPLVQMVF
jgi:hypothetical protein